MPNPRHAISCPFLLLAGDALVPAVVHEAELPGGAAVARRHLALQHARIWEHGRWARRSGLLLGPAHALETSQQTVYSAGK